MSKNSLALSGSRGSEQSINPKRALPFLPPQHGRDVVFGSLIANNAFSASLSLGGLQEIMKHICRQRLSKGSWPWDFQRWQGKSEKWKAGRNLPQRAGGVGGRDLSWVFLHDPAPCSAERGGGSASLPLALPLSPPIQLCSIFFVPE